MKNLEFLIRLLQANICREVYWVLPLQPRFPRFRLHIKGEQWAAGRQQRHKQRPLKGIIDPIICLGCRPTVSIYTYVCIYIYIYQYVYVYIYIYISICICIYIYIYISIYIYIYLYIYKSIKRDVLLRAHGFFHILVQLLVVLPSHAKSISTIWVPVPTWVPGSSEYRWTLVDQWSSTSPTLKWAKSPWQNTLFFWFPIS